MKQGALFSTTAAFKGASVVMICKIEGATVMSLSAKKYYLFTFLSI